MKNFCSFILFAFFCTLSAFSQTNLTLSGILFDKANHEPIFAGTVQLLRARDSVYVDGAISNDKGAFTLQNLKAGNYILKVTYIGYLTLFKNVSLSGTVPVTRLGELAMGADEVLLKEAVVEGKRPEIAVKNDTVEYDAASYKAGGDDAVVEDLLKKLPGVEVDKDGKITAQGKTVNKMFVNGKEFFRDDPQIATKNIPADMVDKVQVYDRKSDMAQMTGFDNGDEETVINLTVRSNMLQGTIGTIQLGGGRDVQTDNNARYSESAFVRHQRGSDAYTAIIRVNNNNNMGGADIMGGGGGGGGGRGGGGGGGGGNPSGITKAQNYMLNINEQISSTLNINGDVRYSRQERKIHSDVLQTTFANTFTQQETINRDIFNAGNNFNSNFRIDWNPNKQNALIIRPNIRLNQPSSDGLMFDNRINADNGSVILDSKSITSSGGNSFGTGGSLDYSFRFPKPGRVFSISASGNYNNNYSQPKNITYYRNPIDSLYNVIRQNQIAENRSLTNNFGATFSYVEPIGHNNYIQLLYRYSYSETESKNSTYNIFKDFSDSSGIAAFDTAMIVPSQSRTILRDATDQRFGINFKADRKKFNLTFGFNIDPSKATNETYQPSAGILPPQPIPIDFSGKLPLLRGDSLISSIPINVVNYSPTVIFRYIFDQRSNLRINYEGETNQPSADQLRNYPYVDINSPNDVTIGNPNLKPGYTNTLRIEFNKYVPATQLMYGFRANGNYVINDIITVTQVQQNKPGNTTTYQNINGNWNLSLLGMINKPVSKKFSVGNMLRAVLSNDNSFLGTEGQQVKNLMQNRMIGDNLNLRLQLNDSLYIGTNGSANYNNITYTAVPKNNQKIYNYSWGANILWSFLPGWTFDSDINRTWRSGYPVGYNVTQTLWNAGIAKRLFKKQSGTGSIKLQVFDILQDRKNIVASQSASSLQFSQTNVIPSYFLASFIYRFSIFPKSSLLKEGDMAPQRRGPGRDGGPGGRPPGGGGFGGDRRF